MGKDRKIASNGAKAETSKNEDIKSKSARNILATGKKQTIVKNPLRMCYVYLFLTSFVNFIDMILYIRRVRFEWSMIFGTATLFVCFLILICEKCCTIKSEFDFPKLCNGKLEGGFWFFSTIWWIVGVGYLTKTGGIAYEGLNIYFSSWLSLFISAFSYNRWLAENNCISFSELTRLSKTLKLWYCLLISSVVEMGSATHFFGMQQVRHRNQYATLAICAGTISSFFSLLAILFHYKILTCCGIKPGGKSECAASIILNLWWIGCFFNLTTNGKVAPTISGTCQKISIPQGSNMYFSIWTSLIVSVMLTIRWVKSKAVSLATAESDHDESENSDDEENGNDEKAYDIAE